MKALIVFFALIVSTQVFACPNLTGSFYDAENEVVKTITQKDCATSTWNDGESETTLIADGVERILQQEKNITAYAKVYFTKDELVIDIRMDWGEMNEFDLPARWFTAYRIDKFNNMVERIIPYKEDGTQLATEYVTFRRVNSQEKQNSYFCDPENVTDDCHHL